MTSINDAISTAVVVEEKIVGIQGVFTNITELKQAETKIRPLRKIERLELSMVLGTVKVHNGFIRVESTPGRGTLFQIYLPLAVKTETEDRQHNSITRIFS